jgi:hypothetical protein
MKLVFFILLDTNFENVAYVYLHKNKSIFNKWIFIDNYREYIEKDEDGMLCKFIEIKDSLNVMEYKKNKIFIYHDSICKFNTELKFQYVNVNIKDIEIYDEVNSKNLNFFELKSQLFSLYSNFKSFMMVIFFKFRVFQC